MDALREYIFSVTAAAILCACVRSIAGEKGAAARVVKLICGLFLAFTVIRPVARIQLSDFAVFTSEIQLEAAAAATMGEDYAAESLEEIIKQQVRTYILDKAQALGAQVEVAVTLSDGPQPVPDSVTIIGPVAPYARSQLQKILEEDLGIPKEAQQWTG